jgi:hypothetical protein
MTMRRHTALVHLSITAALATTCARVTPETPLVAPTPRAAIPDSVTAPPSARAPTVNSLMASLTVRQKVSQLIMPWLIGHYTALDSKEFDRISYWVDSLEVGGIIISVGSPLDANAKLQSHC